MPIRSDRGRNATLRALATWPLYSPRRLISTIAALVVLCVAVTIVASTGTKRESTPAATTPEPAWTISRSITVSAPSSSAEPSVAVVVGDPVGIARRFADAWVSKLDAHAWREAVAPLCTNEFRAVMLPTLAADPASVVTGQPTLTRAGGGVAELTVQLNTMTLALTLHDASGRGDWRIADAQPARR